MYIALTSHLQSASPRCRGAPNVAGASVDHSLYDLRNVCLGQFSLHWNLIILCPMNSILHSDSDFKSFQCCDTHFLPFYFYSSSFSSARNVLLLCNRRIGDHTETSPKNILLLARTIYGYFANIFLRNFQEIPGNSWRKISLAED